MHRRERLMDPGWVLGPILGALLGCTSPDGAGNGQHAVAAPAGAREHGCDVSRHRELVGQPIDGIDTGALPGPLRVYRSGSRITMDHRPDRLNIVLDPDGRVAGIRCG